MVPAPKPHSLECGDGQNSSSATCGLCYSLRFGSTIFSGELWIQQTNNHISQPMTDTTREIIFTFKSPKSMTIQVTSVDGKTLVSASCG